MAEKKKPAPAPSQSDKQRDRAAIRSRRLAASASEIGPPPKRDEKLWKRYRHDLFRFLSECFPYSTGLSPLSPDHRHAIERIQDTILSGGGELIIVFRGWAKSTIQELSAVWSAGYGHRKFFVPLCATEEMAKQGTLASIQYEFETNDLLMAIFPEACHCARALEGVVQRARKQSMNGQRTCIEWSSRRCVLPTCEGFAGSGAIIWPKGITSNIRGLRYKRPDGEQARPDFVMGDDLQTDESAANPNQCAKRIKILQKTVKRLGGHNRKLAIVINGTVIEPDDVVDQLSDPKRFPSIRTMRIPMLKSFSKAHDSEWLSKYADLLTSCNPDDDADRDRAEKAANAYYKKHRRKMDAGAEASWESCYDHEHELSAIQHAYNILILDGEDAFMAECQNAPVRDAGGLEILKPQEICRRQSTYPRGQFPAECTLLAFHCDVHNDIFYFEVWAGTPNFTIYKIDEGTFPDQRRKYFAHRSVPRKLRKLLPGRDPEAVVTVALDQFLHGSSDPARPAIDDWPGIMHRTWTRADGVPLSIGSGLVDANGVMRDVVVKQVSASPFNAIVRPSFGVGITASKLPISAWPQTREQKIVGPEWIYGKPTPGEVPPILFDSNYWKTRLHRALALADGSQGAARLYKARPDQHRLAADHYVSESATEVTVGSRSVFEFRQRPNTDNHKLDNAVGAMVALSRGGISNINRRPTRSRRPKRRTTYYG